MKKIYIIKNDINDKKYIGQTSKQLEERMKQHIIDSKKQKCMNRDLYKDMNKYGIDKFHIYLIETCDNNISDELEIYYIDKYDSFKNGYNNTYGGKGKHIIDYKKIVIDYKKYQNIRIVSNLNNCHRDTIKYILEKNGIKIKQSNIISKEKMSKKVVQKDKNGNILNEFSSVTNAALYLGNINYISNIARVCNGIRKTCKGYIWEYI